MSYTELSCKHLVSRKQRPCIWCGEFILVGEGHVQQNGVYEGEFQSNRFHRECHPAMLRYFRESDEEDFTPHEFKRGTIET